MGMGFLSPDLCAPEAGILTRLSLQLLCLPQGLDRTVGAELFVCFGSCLVHTGVRSHRRSPSGVLPTEGMRLHS